MQKIYKKNVLIVGAGLAGATIARVLAENNIKVTIIEKRNHIAGNIYDFVNSNNERIHKYGPHLLHCNKSSEALTFLSRFTSWIKYEHKVKALLKNGDITDLPINQNTIEKIFKRKFSNSNEVRLFLDEIREKDVIPKNTAEYFLHNVGKELSDIFFLPYTKKMWGIDPQYLSNNIGSRLPIRTNKDDKYFNDSFQALPKDGYTKMVENILSHENIDVILNTEFEKNMASDYDHVFLCCPIDQYFNFVYGRLPYRSILFDHRELFCKDLPSAVVNFTDNSIYTRKTQWSLLPNSSIKKNSFKTITFEIPCSIENNPSEYYYPVQTNASKEMYLRYKNLTKQSKKITFCGRTGLFKYIDMIPAVLIHLNIAKEFIKNS